MVTSTAQAESKERDGGLIDRVLDHAHLNSLRLALIQQTGDPDLAAIPVETFAPAGTPYLTYVVPRRFHAVVRERARAYLTALPRPPVVRPDKPRALELMKLFQGDDFDPAAADYGYEELAFDDYPRDARWSGSAAPASAALYPVVVVGAGFSGILAGIQLKRLGIPFRILERQDDIGGTWQLNDYPEARVDITSFLYQYSFEKNYPWCSYFATRAELKTYIDHVVDRHGIRDHIETRTSLAAAQWNAERKLWELTISGPDGVESQRDARIVISAAGLFSTPKIPDIAGIAGFGGKTFHTTAWDHDYDYRGKRVALIGTGSTGSQLMPEVARELAHLTVFQRTPNWVTPVRGYRDRVSDEQRWLFDNMPSYVNWFNYHNHIAQMQAQKFHTLDADWIAQGGLVNRDNDQLRAGLEKYIASKVGHRPDLHARLVPDYAPAARRLVVDNGWYDALLRDNVELVTDPIETFTSTGIATGDGVHREFDLVILSAGFAVSKYLWPAEYVGLEGATPAQLWETDGARAYLTVALPDLPNFFMLYGPNAGARAGSFHSWMEALMRFIAQTIVALIEGEHDFVVVRREAFDAYNHALDQGFETMLWGRENGGGGYYINEFGRPAVGQPWTLAEFDALIRKPDLTAFEFG